MFYYTVTHPRFYYTVTHPRFCLRLTTMKKNKKNPASLRFQVKFILCWHGSSTIPRRCMTAALRTIRIHYGEYTNTHYASTIQYDANLRFKSYLMREQFVRQSNRRTVKPFLRTCEKLAYAKCKGAGQLHGIWAADQCIYFRYIDRTIPLYPKCKIPALFRNPDDSSVMTPGI